MALSVETLAASKHYTDDSISGITGVLAGKNCTIGAITDIAGGHRVTFKWTADDGTVKTATMDVKDGPQGIQGVKGDTGNTGATGATGEKGDAATISIGTVQSGASPAVTNSGTSSNAVLNFTLPKGDKGDRGEKGEKGLDGKSFEIKAKYANLAALIAEHPTGTAGEAYLVGDNDNPDLYIWLTEDEEWFNNGKIAGVKGDKGDTGDDGYSPVASVTKSGHTVTISIQDKTGQTTETVSDGQDGADGADGASAYDVAVEEGFVGSKSEWLASLVGAAGAPGANGTNGSDGISPVANVTKNGDVIKIHIQDAEGITEQTIDTSTYATKSALGAVTEKIPSNASVSNKLATASDIVTRHDYSVTGTADAIADTKALVNHIITLGVGTYAGEFKRSGITFGSYRLTYLPDVDGSVSVSGTVTYSISNDNDATYQVSYVLSSGSSTPYWRIEKLVTARENNFTFTTLPSPTDFNTVKTPGVYTFGVSEKDPYHAPIVGTFTLIVSCQNNDWVQQLAIFNGDGKIFVRISSSGNWGDWERLVTENENTAVKWIGNAGNMTLAQIFSTYAQQNNVMYKGFFDWQDARVPLYGQGADTVEITCYDWNLTATTIHGKSFYYNSTTGVWIENSPIVILTASMQSDSVGNLALYSVLPAGADVEIISVRNLNPEQDYECIPGKNVNGDWWCQLFSWTGVKVTGEHAYNIEIKYRRLA